MKKLLSVLLIMLLLVGCSSQTPKSTVNSIQEELPVLRKPTIKLYDYNDNLIELGDNFVLEIMATWCPHCQEQVQNENPKIIEFAKQNNIQLVQYLISDGYVIEDIYPELPENVILIKQDETFESYLFNDLGVEYLPTFICFKNGEVTNVTIGSLPFNNFKEFIEK